MSNRGREREKECERVWVTEGERERERERERVREIDATATIDISPWTWEVSRCTFLSLSLSPGFFSLSHSSSKKNALLGRVQHCKRSFGSKSGRNVERERTSKKAELRRLRRGGFLECDQRRKRGPSTSMSTRFTYKLSAFSENCFAPDSNYIQKYRFDLFKFEQIWFEIRIRKNIGLRFSVW